MVGFEFWEGGFRLKRGEGRKMVGMSVGGGGGGGGGGSGGGAVITLS